MGRELPGSVRGSLQALGALVLLSGIATLLSWWQRDELVLSWGRGNTVAREILAEGGLDALLASPSTPKFVPIAVVAFVFFAVLVAILGALLVEGHNWARVSLTATVLMGMLVAALGITYDPPVLFTVVAAATLLLSLATLVLLWHRDTGRYLRDF